ncbi:NAD(P)-binding protein [Phlegmacium glaucopus]|nr:NAD(P)-binding protein [Phlegmacium glaucopus]
MSKVILVTGANSGIGFELVRLLAEKKHTVYIGARNETAGKEAQAKLHADGLKTVKYVNIDVTKLATIEAAKETIHQAEGKLDVLVNNAGIGKAEVDQRATSLSIETIREVMETNFFGLVQTTIAFLPLLRKSANAAILNVSSELGSNSTQARPNAGMQFVAYSASKTAANSYTIALAQELRGEGIKVNAVTPGLTATKLNNYRGKSTKAGAEALLPWALMEKDGPTCLFIASDGKSEYPW